MKKRFALAGVVFASALALTGCAGSGMGNIDYSQQSPNDGGDFDWDLGHKSSYNNKTYCKGGTYTPVSNGYTCTTNGITSAPTPRPSAPTKPLITAKPTTSPKQTTAPKPAAPKPAAPKSPAKTGK